MSGILFLIFSFGQITSCTPDKCKGVTCQNGGTCSKGNCNCATGYEGANCQTKANSKFVATYAGQSICDGTNTPENIPLEAGVEPFAIIIHLNSLQQINATVSGNSITIPLQTLIYGVESYRFSGSGTLNGNNLNYTLYVLYTNGVDPDYSYICTFSGNK